MGVKQTFVEFCNKTSLPGWGQAANARNIPLKLFWALLLIAAHLSVLFLCYTVTTDYLTSTTLPIIKTTTGPISDIKFPALVFCNVNQIQASFMRKLGFFEDEMVDKLFRSEFMWGRSNDLTLEEASKLQELKDKLKLHYNWTEFKYATDFSKQKCSDMFQYGFWQGNPNLFKRSDAPDLDAPNGLSRNDRGTCCYLSIEQWFHDYVSESSTDSGLHFMLDLETHEYFDTSYGTSGIRFWIGDPSGKPMVSSAELNLSPGMEYLIEMSPTLLNISKDTLQRFSPEQRDCYTADEFVLQHFSDRNWFNYSMDNCEYNTAIEATLQKCNCHPFFTPSFLESGGKVCMGKAKACEKEQLKLVLKGSSQLSLGKDGTARKCLPACNQQYLVVKQSGQEYPMRKTFHKRKDICMTFRKIQKICQVEERKITFEETYGYLVTCEEIKRANLSGICLNDKFNGTLYPELSNALFSYATDNLLRVKIFFKSPFYTLITKESQIALGAYIGNMGGLLGMMLGLTAFGVVEMLSFSCVFLYQLFKIEA